MKTYILVFFILFLAACGINKTETLASENGNGTLPFLGEPTYVYTDLNGETFVDTVLHTIPPFSFIDQDGNTVTEKDVAGKIYVADFFFTTCPSICPIMTGNLKTVQETFKNEEDFMILSHTIDPSFDTPQILAKYATEKNADTKNWKFLTGDLDSIYHICENFYMAYAKADQSEPGGYVHSGFLILIDQNRHIRGAYDGTNEGKTEDLIRDIRILLAEQKNNTTHKK